MNRMGNEPVGKLLLTFSIPSIIAMLANALYNVVDSIFVGRGVGALALTAVTISFPIMILLLAFGMLVGIGATALVSIRLGQQKKDEAEKILGNAVSVMILMGIVIGGGLSLVLDPLLVILGATPDVFDYAKDFTSIILLGSIFQFISFGINHIIRAEGNPMISMMTMLFSAGMNALLNPLFIFVFHWGVKGSALATVTTQCIVSAYILYHFTLGKSNLKLKRENMRIDPEVLKTIFAIGMSPFLLQASASVTSFLFNSYLMRYGGEMAVASMGVINRTAMMILMPIFGINQGSQPIIGYNYGAKQFARVKKALWLGSIAATTICVAGFAAIQLNSEGIIRLFNDDAELLRIGAPALKIFMFSLPIIGVQVIITNYFQAVGKAKQAILLSLTRQVLFLIPLIIFLPLLFNLNGIWYAGPTADIMAALLAFVLLYREFSHLDDKMGESIQQ